MHRALCGQAWVYPVGCRQSDLAVAVGEGASPMFVNLLLLKVSGVPLSKTKFGNKYADLPEHKK
jgi:hypothetical protein